MAKKKFKAKDQEATEQESTESNRKGAGDDNNANTSEASVKKSKKKIILLSVVIVIVCIVLGVVVLLFIGGKDESAVSDESPPITVEEKSSIATKPKALYYNIKPSFIVRLQTSTYKKLYLEIDVSVLAREQSAIDDVELHSPLIRNDLNNLFSNKSYDQLSTIAGKDSLRMECADAINKVLKEQGSGSKIETVLFTKFVVQ